jgi:hypothetical protein
VSEHQGGHGFDDEGRLLPSDAVDPFGETIAAELAARLLRRRQPLDPFGEQVAAELAARLLRRPGDQPNAAPEHHIRWEYRVDEWRAGGSASQRAELLNLLNTAGTEGWELVSMDQLSWSVILTFKRPRGRPGG